MLRKLETIFSLTIWNQTRLGKKRIGNEGANDVSTTNGVIGQFSYLQTLLVQARTSNVQEESCELYVLTFKVYIILCLLARIDHYENRT